MASNAFSGVGTKFQRGDGASNESFSDIAEINSITGPNLSRDTIDVTSLDSTGGYREFIAGFRDGGELTLSMNFAPSGYFDLKDDFEVEVTHNYRIVMGNAAQTTFDITGLITALGVAIPLDDKVTCDVTIKITGEVTLTT